MFHFHQVTAKCLKIALIYNNMCVYVSSIPQQLVTGQTESKLI